MSYSETGAHERDRTADLVLTKDVLYRLSYVGRLFKPSPASFRLERVMGIEPTSTAWKAEVLPLNYTRLASPVPTETRAMPASLCPCMGWPRRAGLVEGVGFEPTKA